MLEMTLEKMSLCDTVGFVVLFSIWLCAFKTHLILKATVGKSIAENVLALKNWCFNYGILQGAFINF